MADRRVPPSFRRWSTDPVRARSKFWYFLRKLKKVNKSNGQIIAVNEIFEEKPTVRPQSNPRFWAVARASPCLCRVAHLRPCVPQVVKNYGIWVRYQSRTGFHNLYKEFRDTTLNGAVEQMYDEMGGRHRVRAPCIQIIKTATIPNEMCKRDNTTQFHADDIKFPLTHKCVRPSSKSLKTTFKYVRPSVAI